MRQIAVLLCAAVVGSAPAFAQGPQTAETPVPPAPVSSPCVPSAIDCLPVSPTSGCLYAEGDCLLLWFKPVCAAVPILSIGNPRAAVPGAVGQPGTQIVVGGSPPHQFDFPMTPGAQVTLGWDRGDGAVGVKVSGFIMERATNSQQFNANPNGSPFTYLPYQAPDNSFQALPFTIPGVVTGSSEAVGSTRVWGIESNLAIPFTIQRCPCAAYGCFLVGGRYLDLTDRVQITNTLRLVADPSDFAIGMDQFSTRNQFAGPQLGTMLGLGWDRCSVELTSKLAAGVTHQVRTIAGSPLASASDVSSQLVPGPLLALPSNIGREAAYRATLVPEIGINTRLALTSWCSLSLGYSLLYWNKVLCPGDQMDPLVNITQLPFHGPLSGALDPSPKFVHTDYFAQGLNLGIQFRY